MAESIIQAEGEQHPHEEKDGELRFGLLFFSSPGFKTFSPHFQGTQLLFYKNQRNLG